MRIMDGGKLVLAGLVTLGLAACEEGTGPGEGSGQVAVAFASTGGSVAAAPAAPAAAASMAIPGTNGTLVLDELWIIVSEFELDRLNDDDCDDDQTGSNDDCEKFQAPPAFVSVPLNGGQATAVTASVAPDTYDEMEFEIEDLDDDEENPTAAQQIEELLAEIRAQFPDWPREASMLVVGTFTPTGGEPQQFRVYFEAEVEIEMELSPPVTITDDGDGATFTVTIDPGLWFTRGDGTVWNLASLDYDDSGELVEFEVEIEDGFAEVEFDDD